MCRKYFIGLALLNIQGVCGADRGLSEAMVKLRDSVMTETGPEIRYLQELEAIGERAVPWSEQERQQKDQALRDAFLRLCNSTTPGQYSPGVPETASPVLLRPFSPAPEQQPQ